jgi:hypothetical protein
MLLAVSKRFHPLGRALFVLIASLHRCHANFLKVTVTPSGTTYENGTSSDFTEPYPKTYNSPGFGDRDPFVLKEGWDNETIGDWVASSANYNNLADPYPDVLYPSAATPYDFDNQRIVLHNRGSCNLPDDGIYTKITKSIFLEAGKYSIVASVAQTTSLKPLCHGINGYGQTGISIDGVATNTYIYIGESNYCLDFTTTFRLNTVFDVSASKVTDIAVYVFSRSCADTISYVDNIEVSEIIAPSAPPSSIPSAMPSLSPSAMPSVSSLPSQSPSNPPSTRPSAPKKRKSPVKECLGEAMLHVKCGCKDTVGPRCFHQVNKKHCLKEFKNKNRRSTRKQQGDFQQKTQKAYVRECEIQKQHVQLTGAAAVSECFTC